MALSSNGISSGLPQNGLKVLKIVEIAKAFLVKICKIRLVDSFRDDEKHIFLGFFKAIIYYFS